MIWLTWRQHRAELIGLLAIVAAVAIVVLAHGLPMYEAHDRDGIAACWASSEASCMGKLGAFNSEFGDLPESATSWLPLTPLFAGILIGAPFLAREFEQGTWQLAWTQGVSRSRWLLVKLGLVLLGVLAAAAMIAALLSWWLAPLHPHRFSSGQFNHGVLVFPSYVLWAVAVGITAGAFLRRTIVAAAVGIVAWLAVRLPVEFMLRPNYRTPLTTNDPEKAALSGWMTHEGVITGPASDVARPEGGPMQQEFTYQPLDRFWQFQIIEASIFVGLSVLLLAATFVLVTRVRR